MAKETKAIEGQIVPKDDQVPDQTNTGPGFSNIASYWLRGRAMAKAAEVEARYEEANRDAAFARASRLRAEEDALQAEERLSDVNRVRITRAVSENVIAELEEAERRREKAERDRARQEMVSDNDDLEELARTAELKERLLTSKIKAKKLNARLSDDGNTINDEIAKAEAEQDSVMAEIAQLKRQAEEAGNKPDMERIRTLSRKLQSILDRLEKLRERRDRDEDDLED